MYRVLTCLSNTCISIPSSLRNIDFAIIVLVDSPFGIQVSMNAAFHKEAESLVIKEDPAIIHASVMHILLMDRCAMYMYTKDAILNPLIILLQALCVIHDTNKSIGLHVVSHFKNLIKP